MNTMTTRELLADLKRRRGIEKRNLSTGAQGASLTIALCLVKEYDRIIEQLEQGITIHDEKYKLLKEKSLKEYNELQTVIYKQLDVHKKTIDTFNNHKK